MHCNVLNVCLFSEKSKFDNKTAIRGGIPIVFRQLSFDMLYHIFFYIFAMFA